MFGITSTRNHVSVNNVDVSGHFNLPAGSIKVSFSSVDVIAKNGNLDFFLAGNGDQRSTWTVTYADDKRIKVSHGGALAGKKDDIFISKDSTSYTFSGGLKSGLSHAKPTNSTYRVHNSTGSKIFNSSAFVWTANSSRHSFSFDVKTTAQSASGKGSKFDVYVDDSKCQATTNEHCDDGNTVSGDGCDDSCQIEAGYVCQEDLANATWSDMYDYTKTCTTTGNASVLLWSRP